MEVVLSAKAFLIRRLWVEQPNHTTIRTDVQDAEINGMEAITPETIRKGLPQDWKQVESKPID